MNNCNCREFVVNFTLINNQEQTATFSLQENTISATFNMSDKIEVYDKNFIFEQAESSDVWNIIHNLNKMPSIVVVDEYNRVVTPEIEYVSNSQIIVRFNYAFKGKAFLN